MPKFTRQSGPFETRTITPQQQFTRLLRKHNDTRQSEQRKKVDKIIERINKKC